MEVVVVVVVVRGNSSESSISSLIRGVACYKWLLFKEVTK